MRKFRAKPISDKKYLVEILWAVLDRSAPKCQQRRFRKAMKWLESVPEKR